MSDPGDLSVRVTEETLCQAVEAVKRYFPDVRSGDLVGDYCGMRPKLAGPGSGGGAGFQDFVIREEEGFPGFVNLLGIESPGNNSLFRSPTHFQKLLRERRCLVSTESLL